MIKKFNEMDKVLTKNVFYKTKMLDKILVADMYVQYLHGKPSLAHFGDGVGRFYPKDFAITYDEIVQKLITNNASKRRLLEIKDDFINFLDSKEIGTKVYIKDTLNKSSEDVLECVWDGKTFRCGRHMFFNLSDLFVRPFYFQKPDGKNIITDWTYKGHTWNDNMKSWVKNK